MVLLGHVCHVFPFAASLLSHRHSDIVEDTKTKPCLYPGLVDCSHSKHIVVILVVT